MLKISSSRDEVIEKVKAFLGAMAEGSGADEGAAPGVETPPPERARLGDRAIPADRLVRLSALVSVALNEKASDKEAPEQGDRTIGALITAPVAAPVPRFLQAGLVSTRPVEPRGARTQKGGKKRKAAKEPKEKKKAEKRASKAKSEQGAPEEARAAGEPDSGGDEDEGMAPYYQRARARWGLPAVTIKSSLADDAVHSGPGAAPAPLPKDWAGGLPPELLEKVARAVPAGDRLFFQLVCTSWAKAGTEVTAVPPGERPLGPGKATRTRGPRWRWAPLKDRRGRGSRAACALTLPGAGTSKCSSGRGPTGAPGTKQLARWLPRTGTSRSSSGRGPTGAPGTNGRARMLP